MKLNDKYELEINDIIQPILHKKTNRNYDTLLEKFNHRFEETKYPGFKYAIGLLYEHHLIFSSKPNKYFMYYTDAANQSYLPAVIKLCELYIYDLYYETTLLGVNVYAQDNYKELKNDAYGEYLLAKYGMIRSLIMKDEYEDFNDALVLMKESAYKGCLDAKEFLKKAKLENENKLDILKIAAY